MPYAAKAAFPAVKYGMAIAKYGGPVAKYAGYGHLAKKAYNGYKNYNNSRPPPRASRASNPAPSGRGYRKFNGVNEGHTISSSSKKTTKKSTKADILLKAALPQLQRTITQKFQSSTEGGQDFTNNVTLWNWSDLNTYGPTVSTTSEHRFYVDSCNTKIVYTNFTSTPVQLTIYDYHYKKDDTSLTVENTIQNGLSAKYNSVTEWQVPYMNPSESSEFRNFIKVESTKHLTLSPGEVHIHTYFRKIEKYFTSNEYSNISPLPTNIKGITTGVFTRLIGTPVTDDTKISYAATKIGMIIHNSFSYKTPQGPVGSQMVAGQTGLPQTALTTEKYMNEETGLATVNTGA